MTSNVLVPDVDTIAYILFMVLAVGMVSLLISRRFNVSYVPLFVFFGILAGPVLGLINRSLAHELFSYVRVFGLVMILFAEGHTLSWKMLKRNMGTIAVLDTVGLLITAVIAGIAFSVLFHTPFIVGFLFGAIIGATDPATLIPLFRQYKVKEDIETVIVTESIFNDPLGIVLTSVAIALLLPQAPSAAVLESIARYISIYPAAVVFFLYELGMSIGIGVLLGVFGYYFIKKTGIKGFPEIEVFALMLAFGGFLLGEYVKASGYLVATVTGIVLGNHKVFFRDNPRTVKRIMRAIEKEVHFNESLATLATIFIFALLGASLDMTVITSNLLPGMILAFVVILIARPIAVLPILPWWKPKEYLFIALEGPRGVVPSALASLPLTLGLVYHDQQMIQWGEIILGATVITVLVSVIVETLWVPLLRERLLEVESIRKRMIRSGYKPKSSR
ncbi:cation:proton antiporter [Thermococcus barophilus]|uniref:Na+/H+ antiporter n=1 Tax=Thermococcus barophilus TaxID=55802 RepID=A0A0S1XFQ8_THEBA|nr:sodium:proton antiporter [Thermococcus barophilus]ALM76574.1 Na+/H+ antiporter [Thermococcus barophilus]